MELYASIIILLAKKPASWMFTTTGQYTDPPEYGILINAYCNEISSCQLCRTEFSRLFLLPSTKLELSYFAQKEDDFQLQIDMYI